jgi:lipopolysaccharide biosynthesis protein
LKIRTIAIYLPQFHPTQENDEWWGKGFTEWTNVVKAKPLFKGHYQPHLPTDLGFYDLRVPEVREAQAQLAKEYGIYGFCYYHYWFNGKRIIERPFREILESGTPDFPFMLCWANENWTKTWSGGDNDILLEQKYSHEDDREHIQYLLKIFKDNRYIKIDNKPVIAIYRSTKLPEVVETLKIWRQEAKKMGMELYICRFESFGEAGSELLDDSGFDAAIEFQPNGQLRKQFQKKIHSKFINRVFNKFYQTLPNFIKRYFYLPNKYGDILDYQKYVNYSLQQPAKNYKIFPTVTPMWDNSARKKKDYVIFKNSTPEIYENWIKKILKRYKPYSKEENLFFINAWNEWAEGNHLEPCAKWGKKYLEATKRAFEINK